MKRWLCAIAVLGGIWHQSSHGQVPAGRPTPGNLGPGDQGAVLRTPGLEPTLPTPNPSGVAPNVPAYVRNLIGPSGAFPAATKPGEKIAQLPSNHVEINRDIEITPDAGPWAIFVMAYSGPKAPDMARKFVAELRNTYKLPAYIYNAGAEEKRQEYERVQKLRQKQIDALKAAHLKADVPIRIPTMRIAEQTGVLIGGYRTRDEALGALPKLRKIELDPKRVDLDTKFVFGEVLDKNKKKVQVAERVYVNPFSKSLPVRNPTGQKQGPEDHTAQDIKFLRKVNDGEPLSLFQCKKPFTLAVKQFATQHATVGSDKEASGFLQRFNMKKSDEDYAAQNAHNLAAAFRKGGLPETYVLHSRYCSFVTVGGFDGPDDPRLKAMQNFLANRFRQPAYRPLELFPQPVVMQVPH